MADGGIWWHSAGSGATGASTRRQKTSYAGELISRRLARFPGEAPEVDESERGNTCHDMMDKVVCVERNATAKVYNLKS